MIPALSLSGHAQRSSDMGIIIRDVQELCLRGLGGICPRGSSSGRPPTMVGRSRARAWSTVPPLIPYTTTPRGGTLEKFGSPGMMGADDDQAPLCRVGNNLTPPPPPPHTHTFPPSIDWNYRVITQFSPW